MQDKQLIFLISQPRSGSTLLQKILSNSDDIYTESEPWFMLHHAYSLRDSGIYSEYGRESERKAFKQFIGGLPGGHDMYIEKLREFCLGVYGASLGKSQSRYFLDKTPRYYFIVDELLSLFPDAKFIFLRRNPLAVLTSIINSWTNKAWFRLSDFKYDLLDGIDNTSGIQAENNKYILYYENLVNETNETLDGLFQFLGVEYSSAMARYDNNESWEYGDKDYLYSHDTISNNRVDLWAGLDIDKQTWRLLHDYLQLIGPEKMGEFGYSYNELSASLEKNMPADSLAELNDSTFPLASLLDNAKNSLYENAKLLTNNQKLTENNKKLGELLETTHANYSEIKTTRDALCNRINKYKSLSFIKQPVGKYRAIKSILDMLRKDYCK